MLTGRDIQMTGVVTAKMFCYISLVVVCELLSQGINASCTDRKMRSPLHIASAAGNEQIGQHSPLNKVTYFGKSCLLIIHHHCQPVCLLLSAFTFSDSLYQT